MLTCEVGPVGAERVADVWATLTPTPTDSPVTMPVECAQLKATLQLVDTAIGRRGDGTERRTPSAGAIYPFEVAIVDPRPDEGGTYLLDIDRRLARRVLVPKEIRDKLDEAATSDTGQVGVYVLVLTRPWLSMRKYGKRGYLYSWLDAGHAAAAILVVSMEVAQSSAQRVRASPDLRQAVTRMAPGRELHTAVRVDLGRNSPAADDRWSIVREEPVPIAISGLEAHSWQFEVPAWAKHPLATLPWNGATTAGSRSSHQHVASSEIRGLRQSARAFREQVPRSHAVIEMLDWSRRVLPIGAEGHLQPPAPDWLGFHVLLHDRALADEVADGLKRSPIDTVWVPEIADQEIAERCLGGQAFGAPPAGIIVLHVASDRMLHNHDEGMLLEAHSRAAAVSHVLYLGATAAGVGITAIGSYDAALLRRLSGLDSSRELVYTMAFGMDDSSEERKDDRSERSVSSRGAAA